MMSEIVLPKNAPEKLVKFMEQYKAEPDHIVQCFFKIKDKSGNLVQFKYNQPQKLHQQRGTQFDYVLKARKEGISSRRIARDLAICATRRHQHRILLTHTSRGAEVMMAERVKPFIDYSMYPLRAIPRQDYIYFPLTDSRYYVGTAGAKKFGRGDDITGRHYSEYAQWENPDVATGVEESLIENADGLIETTAFGHNFAKKHWEDSKRGRNKDHAIFLPWYVDTGYVRDPALEIGPLSEEEQSVQKAFNLSAEQIAWRRWKKRTMPDPSLFPQEYPETDEEAFLSTGRPVFDKLALAYCRQTCSDPKWQGYLLRQQHQVRFIPDVKGNLKIWRMPEAGHVYAIGSDVAEGLKDGAYSTGEIIDVGDSEQVAEWHGHISPDQLSDVLQLLSSFYNQAIIIPESWPGPGEVTTSHLAKANARLWRSLEDGEFGFKTNQHSKTAMISTFNAALRDYSLTIRSADLLEELHAYVYDERLRMASTSGNYSDRLMAMGIAYFCTRDLFERVDYYAASRVSSLFKTPIKTGASVSKPRWTGHRIGMHE